MLFSDCTRSTEAAIRFDIRCEPMNNVLCMLYTIYVMYIIYIRIYLLYILVPFSWTQQIIVQSRTCYRIWIWIWIRIRSLIQIPVWGWVRVRVRVWVLYNLPVIYFMHISHCGCFHSFQGRRDKFRLAIIEWNFFAVFIYFISFCDSTWLISQFAVSTVYCYNYIFRSIPVLFLHIQRI